ncbi:MAG: hypothetical protein ACTHMG_06985 [Sphingomonas sp.]
MRHHLGYGVSMELATIFNSSVCRVLLAVAVAIAVVMALLPHPPHLPIDSLGDKFEHSLAFVVLTVLAVGAFPQVRVRLIGERMSFLGALIEVFQSIPALHRDCDVLDWLTDTIAISVTLLIVLLIRSRSRNGRVPVEAPAS